MALDDLSLTEMVTATEAWIGADRATFVSVPEIAGLYLLVAAAHAAVVAAVALPIDPALSGVADEAGHVDDRHDHALRAVFFSTLAASEHLLSLDPPDAGSSAKILAARDALLDHGLAGAMLGYGEEAGCAERAMQKLAAHPEHGETLDRVKILGDATALDAAKRLGKLGAALGALEQKRAALEAGSEKPTARKARAVWMKTVATVLAALELAKVTKATAARISGPIARASEKAGSRRAT